MAGDLEEDGAVVFDLVDDDAVDGDAPSGHAPAGRAGAAGADLDGARGSSADETSSGWSLLGGALGVRLRLLAPAAAVLAIALGTGYVLDGVREAARVDAVREVGGGVVDVSAPLTELWEWEGAVGSGIFGAEGGPAQVAALGDLLVFMSEDDLLALEPASGAEAWAIPLGEDPECGPTGYPGWEPVATATVVCVSGPTADREVIAVGPDGVPSAPRALDPADLARYGSARPGPAGTVLRAARAGTGSAPDGGDARCATPDECTGTVESGQDIVVRAADAVTGEERWTVTAGFVATPAAACTTRRSRTWDGTISLASGDDALDREAFGARIGTGHVDLYGCGANASITAEGALLRGVGEPGAGRIAGLTTGGYVASAYGSATHNTVYSADGEALAELVGYPFEASVVDGVGTLLGADESGSRLHAYEPDGTPRWAGAAGSRFVWFAAEVGDTAVLLADDGAVHGLDVSTGRERWVWTPAERAEDAPPWNGSDYQAFTDGRHVLLRLPDAVRGTALVSLDVASGEHLWDAALADVLRLRRDTSLVAVDGNLLAVAPEGVRGLG
ncbi:PQQ-binding-like beta-propeller repeat protein [Promicromonospora sp. NPDC023987]|uniref:outer membrane protein assembly factor BamB family protein n=1 Tax=Promicromonospora sp. NPDC023987 TaxID=3155360 RepID=UPI0033C5C56F